MRVAVIVAFMLLSGAALSVEASAQGAPIDKVRACASVTEDAARLRCFDAAVAGLKAAGPVAAPVEAPVERKIVKAPEAAASPPASARSLVPVPTETPDRISIGVTAIDTGADGKLRFTLTNGETWRQTDTTTLKSLGKGPWEGELRKAALGSYTLKIGVKAPVRVQLVK